MFYFKLKVIKFKPIKKRIRFCTYPFSFKSIDYKKYYLSKVQLMAFLNMVVNPSVSYNLLLCPIWK